MPDPICLNSALFFGWTQTEVEAVLAQVKADIQANGLNYITSASGAGKSVASGQRMTLMQWQLEIRKALQELDPTTYGKRSRYTRSVITRHHAL